MATFLAVDGADGVGKTTILGAAVGELRAEGHRVRVKSIWDSEATAPLRDMLISGAFPDPFAQLGLVIAARRSYLLEHILPALANGETIIMDRWNLTTLYYQSFHPSSEITSTVFKILKGSFYDFPEFFMPPVATIHRPMRLITEGVEDTLEQNTKLQQHVHHYFDTRMPNKNDMWIKNTGEISDSVVQLKDWMLSRMAEAS
jgi:thymidylate kinase